MFISTLLLSVVAHRCYKKCLCQILRLIMSISFLSHFFEDLWFLLLENSILNQDLGAKCAYCYWNVLSFKHSKLAKQGKVCVH